MAHLNAEDLAKMSSEMANLHKRLPRENKSKLSASPDDVDKIIIVGTPRTLHQNQSLIREDSEINNSIDTGIDLAKSNIIFKPDIYTICGYSIPKNTLYLAIVLIIVGAILWYITSNTKKKKDAVIIDEDENKSSNKKDKNEEE